MNAPDTHQWIESNQQALTEEIAWLRRRLENAANGSAATIEPPDARAFSLDFVAEQFQLSNFERSIVLLCAGMELHSEISRLCSKVQGAHADYPTFGLALSVLPEEHWSALSPESPLRYWQLIQLHTPDRITAARLTLDERILHFLLGAGSLDQRLAGFVQPLQQSNALSPSQQQQVERLISLWRDSNKPPVIQIQGNDAVAGRDVTAHASALLGMQALQMWAPDIPVAADERCLLARLLTREHALSRSTLLIDADDSQPAHLSVFMKLLDCPVLLLGERPKALQRKCAVIEVDTPTTEEQRHLWESVLQRLETDDDVEADVLSLTGQFNFSSAAIATTVETLQAELNLGIPLEKALWQTCRQQSRGGLDHLAQRITLHARWDDLILPKGHKAILRDISRQVRHRIMVYETWGFAGKSERGLGISALFAGESGTGKTMAAEVLAGDLHLDLYRIDLSSVVNKYIGETEKNLERLFSAAESSGAILLFDEADALFGKRSDVKDSHDRHANIELAYLLQRMESYRGLSILTSNIKSALDTAFMRRIRFAVQFPFPDQKQRNAIWQHIFPDQLPRAALNIEQLARLNVTGGNIRNIAMNAAFLAADQGKPLCMADLAHATRMEYAKLEKPLNESELRTWT